MASNWKQIALIYFLKFFTANNDLHHASLKMPTTASYFSIFRELFFTQRDRSSVE